MKKAALPLLFLCGCTSELGTSGSDAGAGAADDIFAPAKQNATTTNVIGLWESATPIQDGTATAVGRFDLRADHIVSATRCSDGVSTPVTVSIRVAGTVTASAITTNESNSQSQPIGNAVCSVALGKGTLPACPPTTPESSRANCFALTNNQLVMYQGNGPLALNKISD